MKLRRVVTLTVFVSFIVLALTGVMLYIVPQGRVAYWSGWSLLWLSKEQYAAVHTTFMLLFLVVAIWHIVLNWKAILTYLKNRARKIRIFTAEFNVALGIGLLFFVGTLAGLPPFQQVIDIGDGVKAFWERRVGSPPWGHAEENTLRRFVRGVPNWERLENNRMVQLDVVDAVAALRQAGIEVEGDGQRIIDIARANRTTPQALLGIIRGAERPLSPSPGAVSSAPAAPGSAPAAPGSAPAVLAFPRPLSGLGRITLRDYAERYELDLAELMTILKRAGLEVDPDARLKDEAGRLGTDPGGVIDTLNAEAR